MRAPLKTFADAMEAKLQLKDKDFPIQGEPDSMQDLIERAEDRLPFLWEAFSSNNKDEIKRRTVDIANFMMMVYDKAN